MKQGVSAGGTIIKRINNKPHLLLIKFDEYETVGFAKGHVKNNESLEEAAIREVFEETGIKAKRIIKKIGVVKRLSGEKDEMKTIHIFLMEAEKYDHHPSTDESYGWFTIKEALRKMAFQEEKELLDKVKDKLV